MGLLLSQPGMSRPHRSALRWSTTVLASRVRTKGDATIASTHVRHGSESQVSEGSDFTENCVTAVGPDLCTCADGFMGDNCQVDIDECAQNDPCGVSQSQGHRSEGAAAVDCP